MIPFDVQCTILKRCFNLCLNSINQNGAIISTSHASHFEVGASLINEGINRRKIYGKVHRTINILMEKPMTTEVDEARKLWEMSTKNYPEGEAYIFCTEISQVELILSTSCLPNFVKQFNWWNDVSQEHLSSIILQATDLKPKLLSI